MSGPRPVHVLQPPPIGLWSDKPAECEPMPLAGGSDSMRRRLWIDQLIQEPWRSMHEAVAVANDAGMHEYGQRYGLRWFVHKRNGRWWISRRFFYLQSKKDLRPADHDSERDTSAQQF